MVSLTRSDSRRSGGGFFFSTDGSNAVEDCDEQPIHVTLSADNIVKFKPLTTIPVAVVQLIMAVGLEVTAIILAVLWPGGRAQCEPYFILLYSHAVVWGLFFIIDQFLKREHHKSRINGYLEFHREVQLYSRAPFYIVSLWNTLLLVIATVLHQHYPDLESRCASGDLLSPVNYICAAISGENLLLLPVILVYITKVCRFNASKACPDVQQEEWLMGFANNGCSPGGEVGYRDENQVDDVLEKQSDLIRYLREHNAKLSRKLLVMTEQAKRLSSNGQGDA